MNGLRLLYLIEAICFFSCVYFTEGLLYLDQSNLAQPVKSLYSSGSEDDVAIWMLGVVGALIFLILLLRKYSVGQLLVIVAVGFVLQLFSIFLIQMGSIVYTITMGKNVFLACGCLAQALVFVMVIRLSIVSQLN
jgi:hypothetical protein